MVSFQEVSVFSLDVFEFSYYFACCMSSTVLHSRMNQSNVGFCVSLQDSADRMHSAMRETMDMKKPKHVESV